MSLRGKSICIGSLSFVFFALLRGFIPLENKSFFIAACTVFVIVAVLYYLVAGRRNEVQEHRKQKRYPVLSVIMLTLSFVWSTEVGIVTMVSYAAYSWAWYAMDGERFSIHKVGLLFRELVIYVLLPFVLAYGVINGYNLLAGGSILNFEEFMFPLISDRGYIDSIELPLPDVTHAWTGSAVLFLGITVMSLLYLLLPEKGEEKGEKPYYFLLGGNVSWINAVLY